MPRIPLTPDDPRHGTTAGYPTGCRCAPCRQAHCTQAKRNRFLRLSGRGGRVPAIGVTRRLQALAALGWTSGLIAEHAGYKAAASINVLYKPRQYVHRTTFKRIVDVYDKLSMIIGPSTQGAVKARAKGWLPPLAWDDDNIDNPDHRPDLGRNPRRIDLGEVEFLIRTGETLDNICRRLGRSRYALEQACSRAHRRDLWRFLRDAEKEVA